MRLLFIAFCVVVGAVSAYYAQPYVHNNPDLILIVVTVFTVFAGFLIAIITIIGDPLMIPEGSWRVAEGGRARMEQRLNVYTTLFIFYLITVGLLFIGVILHKALPEHSAWTLWIDRGYLFFGVTSFLFTLALPKALLDLQRARFEAETQRRRRQTGLDRDSQA
jgi:hypothetical protein